MKENKYEKEGKTMLSYQLEVDDSFRTLFSEAKETKGDFGGYFVQITTDLITPLVDLKDEHKRLLLLTAGQGKRFNNLNLNIGDCLKATSYKSSFGNMCVGIEKV